MRGCQEKICKYGSTCEDHIDGNPQCVCSFHCPSIHEPVCGSDNMVYTNDCTLKQESCRRQEQLFVVPMTVCQGE